MPKNSAQNFVPTSFLAVKMLLRHADDVLTNFVYIFKAPSPILDENVYLLGYFKVITVESK